VIGDISERPPLLYQLLLELLSEGRVSVNESRRILKEVSATQRAGCVLVPAEPTAEMIEAAQGAYMPFGDMGFAISAAIAARPEVP